MLRGRTLRRGEVHNDRDDVESPTRLRSLYARTARTDMSSERTPRMGTPAMNYIGRRSSIATPTSDGGDSDDDDEEGGTSLADVTPPPEDTSAESLSQNRDQSKKPDESTPNSLLRLPKTKLNTTRALDWFLGRHLQLNTEDSRHRSRSRARTFNLDIEDDYFDIGDVKDICPACTTAFCQALDSVPFKSSLKLSYNDPISQKWLIGNQYVLQEEVDDHPEDEYVPLVEALRALKTLAPNVPTAKVRSGWKENGKVITICDNVAGERLYDIWWDLSSDERDNIAKQVAQYVEAWRGTDLGRISSLTGGPVYHHANLFGATPEGFGPFGSDLELWQTIERRLESQGVSGDMIQLLRDYMPSSSPCVFTHGDLSSANIIVHEGSVSAITGFENAASLPAWAEDVAMHFCSCPEDGQWKALLAKHTRRYRAALDWWSLWTAVEDAAEGKGTSARKLDSLKTRCERWKKTEIHGEPFWSIWLGHEAGGGGASLKRLNIQTVENTAEIRLGDLVREAVAPYFLRQRGSYDDVSSDTSWGSSSSSSSSEEEDNGDSDDNMLRRHSGRKRGLAPLHPIQQQHHNLVTSASGPPRRVHEEALSRGDQAGGRELRNLIHYGEEQEGRKGASYRPPTAHREFSDTEDLSSDTESSAGGAPSVEDVSAKMKGLRPLSLPMMALSESVRSQLQRAGSEEQKGAAAGVEESNNANKILNAIRENDDKEDDAGERGGGEEEPQLPSSKRTSIYKLGAAPGSFYAVLSGASTEARPKRWSDGGGESSAHADASRRRPQSMLQSSVVREETKDKRTAREEEEEENGTDEEAA